MSSIQRRIAAVTDSATNLIAQLDELDQLREQLRTALLLANSAPRLNRRRRKGDAIPRVFSNRPIASLPAAASGLPGRTP